MIVRSVIALLAATSFYFSNAGETNSSSYEVVSLPQQQSPLQKSKANGKEIYTDFCMQCHMTNGKGDGNNFPPLDGSDWIKKKRKQMIHVVKYGQSGEILVNGKKFNNTMPAPMGLSNQEVADVLNYIMNSWTNKNSKMVTAAEVNLVKQ